MSLVDLDREGKIRELRAQGLGVRAIAGGIQASPSTVSRLLRGTVDHQALAELTSAVETIEHKLKLVEQGLRVVLRSLPGGNAGKEELVSVLSHWTEKPVVPIMRIDLR